MATGPYRKTALRSRFVHAVVCPTLVRAAVRASEGPSSSIGTIASRTANGTGWAVTQLLGLAKHSGKMKSFSEGFRTLVRAA